jgi:hypothetical protein
MSDDNDEERFSLSKRELKTMVFVSSLLMIVNSEDKEATMNMVDMLIDSTVKGREIK